MTERVLPWNTDLVAKPMAHRVALTIGCAAIFAALGVVAAAYSAHSFLRCVPGSLVCGPKGSAAGPAWLFSGLGVGALLGAVTAEGVRHVRRRFRRFPSTGSQAPPLG